jgi:RNA polymerase sigma-70 factor (ECF subfamily)
MRHALDPTDPPEGTLARLFTDHHPQILAYAIRRGASPPDAEDVVADTFTVVWRRIRDLPAREVELAWLYGIAARVLANQRRSRRRSAALWSRLRLAAATAPTIEDAPARDLPEVVIAMKRLRPRDQEALQLSAWEGLANKELAVALRCSENAAAIRLHRARQRLVQELEEEETRAGHLVSRTTLDKPEASR